MNGIRPYSFIAFLACLVFSSCDGSKSDNNALSDALCRLDSELERSEDYVLMHKLRIGALENMLNSRGVAAIREYEIYGELYDACCAYSFDKAKDAVDRQLELAYQMSDDMLVSKALLSKAMLYTKSGLFLDASLVLEKLDTTRLEGPLLAEWYNVRQRFDTDYSDYVKATPGPRLRWLRERYVEMTDTLSSMNGQIRVQIAMNDRNYAEAERINSYFLNTLDRSSHDFAIHAYWQAVICSNLSRDNEALMWWVESAIADVKGAVKDNASLCSLATNLLPTDQIERAFRYVRISMDDALFFNAKLRQIQIASTLPLIEKAYLSVIASKEREKNIIMLLLASFVLVLAMFVAVIVRIHIQGKRSASEIEVKNRQITEYCKSIEEAERNLLDTNRALCEANAAKEEYLGLFMSMCSGYIDKLKKHLSRQETEAELKNFYKVFDTAFLQLYPNFVSDFNSLLKEENRITLKDGELLNTELRIFALIKLGITQSSHIASMLRYSVNTIYNYRAQIKNAALDDREMFEEKVRKIGSL